MLTHAHIAKKLGEKQGDTSTDRSSRVVSAGHAWISSLPHPPFCEGPSTNDFFLLASLCHTRFASKCWSKTSVCLPRSARVERLTLLRVKKRDWFEQTFWFPIKGAFYELPSCLDCDRIQHRLAKPPPPPGTQLHAVRHLAVGQSQWNPMLGTTHFRTYFSGWIGMLTGGTFWILTHGHLRNRGAGSPALPPAPRCSAA